MGWGRGGYSYEFDYDCVLYHHYSQLLVRKLILPSKKFLRNLRGTYNSTILKQSTEKPTAEICDHSPIIPTL